MPTDGPAARPGQGRGLTAAPYVLYVIEQMINVATVTPPFPAGREASMSASIGSVGKAMATPAQGEDVRYWSMCVGVLVHLGAIVWTCGQAGGAWRAQEAGGSER